MVRYHLFGSSVDCVTTLEQACTPGRIRISEPFARALRPLNPFLGGDARDEPGTSAAGGALRSLRRSSTNYAGPGSSVFGPVDASGVSGTAPGVSGVDAEGSQALPFQRRLQLRDRSTRRVPARSISRLALTAMTSEDPTSPEGARDAESPDASGHVMDPHSPGGSTRASFSKLRMPIAGPHGSASGIGQRASASASGVRQQAAAGAAADSEALDLEPAPSLMLKGLGMCRTFHFADVIPRPPHL